MYANQKCRSFAGIPLIVWDRQARAGFKIDAKNLFVPDCNVPHLIVFLSFSTVIANHENPTRLADDQH